jgi:hypothetical protein
LVEGVPIGLGEEGQTVGVLGDGIEAAGVGFFVEVGGFELVEEELVLFLEECVVLFGGDVY